MSEEVKDKKQIIIKKGEHPRFIDCTVMMLSANILPYYAEFNTFLNYYETNTIPTCGVNVSREGCNFYWNRKFVDSLNDKEALFILLHEDFHLLFDHTKRSIFYNKEFSNIAQDMIINQIIYDEIMSNDKNKDKVDIPKSKDEFIIDKNGKQILDKSGKPIKNPFYNKNMGLFMPIDYKGPHIFEDLYEWMKDEYAKYKEKKQKLQENKKEEKEEKEEENKNYAVCVSTTDIKLSGIQIIDSHLLNDGDIVLVNGQLDKTQNGLYNCSHNKWSRIKFLNDNVKYQTNIDNKIDILTGYVNANSVWVLTETNAKNPLKIVDDKDEQLWTKVDNGSGDGDGDGDNSKDSFGKPRYGKNGQNGVECASLDSIFDSIENNEKLTLDTHMDDDVSDDARKSMVNDFMQRLKNRGLVSSDVERILNKLRKTKHDYLKEIKRTISHHVFGTTKRKSITKPNRRGIEGIKGKKKYKNVINCILDTSGSMGGDFESVLSYVFQNDIHINLIQIDTEVKAVEGIKNKKELEKLKIKGLGGTVLQPALNYINDPKNKLYSFNNVMLTDGYCDHLDFSDIKGKTLILTTSTPPTINDPKGKVKIIKIDVNDSLHN